MTNDLTTLNGSLQELGETMATNLTNKGVTASASDGLTTLANKINNISQSGGGGNCEKMPITLYITGSDNGKDTTIGCYLRTNYSVGNISFQQYISGVPLDIKEGETVVHTMTTANSISSFTLYDVSYGYHTYSVEFDGSGTLFGDSSQSVTVLADHNYNLSFSNDDYGLTGNSVTIKCTLTDRGVPVSSETVTFTDQNNNSTTSTTDSNGVASIIVTTETTITASWGNLSTQCNVTHYDFYDDCSIDNTSNYTSINSQMDLTLQSDETYRIYWGTSMLKGVKTNQTFGKNVIIDFDFKPLSSTTDVLIGLYDFNLNDGYRTIVNGRSSSDYLKIVKGAYTSYVGTSMNTQSISSIGATWYNVHMEIIDNVITTSLYKYSSNKSTKTLQKTITATGSLNMGDSNNVIIQQYNSNGIYIDNIKVKEL